MKLPRDRWSARRRRRPRAVRRGFTLVEMLLVLAVIGLVTGLLLPGVNAMLRSINHEEPDRLLLDAVNGARDRALNANRIVELRFDKDTHRLVWSDEAETQDKVLPERTTVQFLQAKEGHSILLGGVLVESQEIPVVRFYADGTCDRFRVQIQQDNGTPQVIAFDPWTCAPMLAAEAK